MRRDLIRVSLLVLLGVCHIDSSDAKLSHFEVRDAVQRDIVQFTSETPLEKIVGLSSGIAGWVELDPEQLRAGVRGELEVDLRTFDTANTIRNDYLREKFFMTSEFPVASFTINRLVGAPASRLMDQKPSVVRVEGSLKLKGLSKTQTVLLKLTYFRNSELTKQRLAGNLLRIASNFEVDLNIFKFALSDTLKFRVSPYIQVSVDTVGTDNFPSLLINIPEPAKTK